MAKEEIDKRFDTLPQYKRELSELKHELREARKIRSITQRAKAYSILERKIDTYNKKRQTIGERLLRELVNLIR